MPNASDYFNGKYVTADELPKDRRITAVIIGVAEETIGLTNERKLVLALSNTAGKRWPRSLPLNKTNGKALIAAFGNDFDGWVGKRIEIGAVPTTFAGKPTFGVRLMALGNGHSTPLPPPTPPSREAGGGDLDDDLPFGPCVQ